MLIVATSTKDPFFIRAEFAPSDRAELAGSQHAAHDLLVPHMRLLQFFSSHYNATRLSSPHTEKAYLRLVYCTLQGLKHATGHPLSREVRFQLVIFGLRVLRFATSLDFAARCRLKDKILSAALTWFAFAPRWTFGGNRLQLRAEARLLSDLTVSLSLASINGTVSTPTLQALVAKENLLLVLIRSEYTRISVWLYPSHAAAREEISQFVGEPATEVSLAGPPTDGN